MTFRLPLPAAPEESGRARVAATRGIAQARRRNRVEIVREGAVYRQQCCNRPFGSWHDAGEHIIENNCKGERMNESEAVAGES